ncbi:hypothetical protein FSP39_009242 [Pinctada imbricata]|uniref:VWFC domain-containing protein n=1 Tax=Pinctada imbricata TaxID=66713 RepID=A0AA88XJQ2_PINIB|nr:hypothetical protein FSP39_009242 [Pinctada imbricata]
MEDLRSVLVTTNFGINNEINCQDQKGKEAISSLECTDGNGKVIKHGDEFFPKKEDPCLKCTCQDGQMVMCRSVSCSPPKTCKDPVPIPGKCCEFNCKDGDGFVFQEEGVTPNITGPGDSNVENTDGGNDSITTLGLRLVASTVTSFLVLALLLFMIHRLRQKRLLVAMRRYRNNRQRERLDEMDADSFSPEFLGIRCPPYEDPPPPYSPPKPEHIHQDAPPPYEVIDSQNNNNTTVTQGGGNLCSGANSYSPQHSNLTSTNLILASDSGTNQNPPNLDVLNNNDIDDEVAIIMTRGGEPTVRYTNSCHPADHRLPNRYINNCDVQTGAPHADLTLPQGRSRRSHGRNRSEPRNSSRNNSRGHLMSYFPRHMDYDMWDESSTATSLSEYHTCRPSRRRSYLDNYSRTFDNSLPPYLSLHLDLDDTSTEASSNVTGYNPVCHHRYGSLPVNSSFSGQSTHTRNSSHDGSREVHRNNVAENPGLICDSENFKSSQDNDEEFNVSVSNMSSSYRRPCNPENPAAVNALENDSVLALEDRNRKLEQIFDSQKLRILRLSKLLQNPSG